ncbi:hypothetical protein BX070DRAFT_222215 [Coemansia spiralis]|nr:hypothetical protein BX070DRAFT_222215 [Coemansia spiralis]
MANPETPTSTPASKQQAPKQSQDGAKLVEASESTSEESEESEESSEAEDEETSGKGVEDSEEEDSYESESESSSEGESESEESSSSPEEAGTSPGPPNAASKSETKQSAKTTSNSSEDAQPKLNINNTSISFPETPAQAKSQQSTAQPDVFKASGDKDMPNIDTPTTPQSGSRRKVQLRNAPVETNETADSESDEVDDLPPRRLAKIPVLGSPSMHKRTSGVLDIAKNQKSGLGHGSGPGIMSISQMANSKPYDELRKKMAKYAATKISSSLQSTPNGSLPTSPKGSTQPLPSDSSSSESESESESESDFDSELDFSGSDKEIDKMKDKEGGSIDRPPAVRASVIGRKMPIRFAGTKSLTDSARARRRKSALLDL